MVLHGLAAWGAEHPLLGREAPNFALRAVAGTNVRLSEHRGDVVVISFWSNRCNPCRDELAALERSHAVYNSAGLRVLGVSVDDDPGRASEFALAQNVSFPMLLDPTKSVSRNYRVDSLPMTLLVDRGGRIRHVHRGDAASEEVYIRQLRALLNE